MRLTEVLKPYLLITIYFNVYCFWRGYTCQKTWIEEHLIFKKHIDMTVNLSMNVEGDNFITFWGKSHMIIAMTVLRSRPE